MLFENLLFTSCLLPGMNKFRENKTFVEIIPQTGETILFFCIDDNSKGHSNCGNCGLRNLLWGKQEGQPVCDLLVFYAKEDRRVLCFVELKDNKKDLHHGTDQVINTCNTLKRKLKVAKNHVLQAFLIGHHGSAPTRHEADQKKLRKEFKDNYIYNAKTGDFAKFLRGECLPLNNRKRKDKKKKNRIITF